MGTKYYSASFQLVPLASATTPLTTMLDINDAYLLKKQTSIEWAKTYLAYGKQNFTRYANYIKTLSTKEKSYTALENLGFPGFQSLSNEHGSNSWSVSGVWILDPKNKLKDLFFEDYNIDESTVESFYWDIFRADSQEETYVKASIENYNYKNDSITEDGITYYYDTYWFDDLNTIRVYFVAEDGTTLEKTIPAYEMITTDPVVGRTYLCATIVYNTGKTQKILYVLPMKDGEVQYIYKDYDFYKIYDWEFVCLPLIPIKKGGADKEQWEYKNYQLIAKRTKNDEDVTGIYGKPSSDIIEKYQDKTQKFYKKCKYPDKIDTYKWYKKACKKMGSDVRQQLSIIYDTMCGLNSGISDEDINKLRKYVYDIYAGFMCPLHVIKQTNIIGHKKNIAQFEELEQEYQEVVNNFKKNYPDRPELVEYAYFTYNTKNKIYDA